MTPLAPRASWFIALSLAVVGCSAATPSSGPTATRAVASPGSASASTAQAATPSTSVVASPLEGVWATGSIPIADIKSSMIAAGIDPSDADAWIAEVGSPTHYSFVLAFRGASFTHSEETPDMAMQVGESGTYVFSGKRLVLTLGDAGNVDTYTFDATLSGNELSLRWLDSTEQGTAEDKAKHRQYTIAFYCSARFSRQP